MLVDVGEEPEALAIQILQPLRRMPANVTEAGVDPFRSEIACKAMVAAAHG